MGLPARAPARLLAGLFVVVGCFAAAWILPADAHAQLQTTTPEAGAVLTTSPAHVSATFGENVEIQFGAVRVYDSNAHRVDNGRSYHPHGDQHSVATDITEKLPAGGYVVTWRVISADSHPVHGAFTFRVGTGAPTADTEAEAARLLAQGAGSRSVGIAFGVVRAIGFLAVSLLIGGSLFLVAAWPEGRAEKLPRQLIWVGWGAALVATLAAIALQGPYGAGLPLSDALKPSVLDAILHTRFGKSYAFRAVVLVLVVPVVARLASTKPVTRAWSAVAAVAAAAVLLAPSLSGHSAVGTHVIAAVPFDVLHQLGAAVWIGGLATLFVALAQRRRADELLTIGRAARRFSQWALLAVVTIALTGTFAAIREVGLDWDALTTTTYGRLVVAKIVIFVVLIAIATSSRRFTHGNLAVPRRRSSPAQAEGHVRLGDLRRAVGMEIVLGVAVFAVTAILVNSIPAKTALALPFSTEVHAGSSLLLDATMDPAKAGPVALHLYVLENTGAQRRVQDVDATVELPSADISPIPVHLFRAGPGHFTTPHLDIPIPGEWVLRTNIRLSKFEEVAADPITVKIR